jgi:zinc transporter
MPAILHHLQSASARGPLPGLIWALSADQYGFVRELPVAAPIGDLKEGWLWLHFNLADQAASSLLEGFPDLPGPAVTLFRARDEGPQIRAEGAAIYGLLSDVQREIGAASEQIGELHFIMTGRILITGRRSPLNAAGMTRRRLLEGLRICTVEDLLAVLVEQVVDGVDVNIERISREVDGLEDRIISGSIGDARGRLARHRQTAVRLRRHISELRLLFQRLERNGKRGEMPDKIVRLASELLQESGVLDRDVAALSDRTRHLQDEVVTLLTEETNKHLRVLAVLSILFLPPTFIAGLFGMNLRGMLFESHAMGFWSAAILAMLSSAAVLIVLKRMGILVR